MSEIKNSLGFGKKGFEHFCNIVEKKFYVYFFFYRKSLRLKKTQTFSENVLFLVMNMKWLFLTEIDLSNQSRRGCTLSPTYNRNGIPPYQ